ncbi:MAG: DUF445 family protein [Candidatus Palauibacterales bacterium]|nr:DUF445 family protein [Candidatus Palauibacterales bacterium]MDP2481900.1 DUF445 family protein [Candidatus Palauibacterales bacterium]
MSELAMQWLRDALTVLFGALAGGLTNRIAITMLFHPYQPPRVLGRTIHWLQGAVPKNQTRMAHTIGNTVGTTLLTPGDVAAELQDERLREAFEEQLQGLVQELFEGEKPAIADLLPESALGEVRRILDTLLDSVRDRVVESLASEEFAEDAARILGTLADSLEDESLADSLGEERIAELRERAADWLTKLVGSESFNSIVRGHLDRASVRLLRPGRSFEELLPVGLIAALEHAISDYLPLAMERLGRLLEDPAARTRVEKAIHDLLDRFMKDLRFHQRVVAKLIITEETVEKVIDTLEAEGADRLGDLLQEGDVQNAMARSVNEAIVDFLRRPVIDVLGEPGDPQVESALESITAWAVEAARDPEVRDFLLDRGEVALLKAGERSWADVVRLVPARRAGGWIASGLDSEAGRSQFGRFKEWLTDRVLRQPIGSLERYGREGAARRLTESLVDPVWGWITGKVPEVAANVRVADRVESKILEFPIPELERLVRSITEKELNLIVRLGYFLGAGIGFLLVLVRRFIG